MDKQKILSAVAIFGGPMGWSILGLYWAEKLRQQYCQIKNEDKCKKTLMDTVKIKDGDEEEYSFKVPKYNVKRYRVVLRHVQDRLEQYRKVYDKTRPYEIILRMLLVDLAVMHNPIEFCEDRVHKQICICGEVIDITIKKSQVSFYKKVAKRLSEKFISIKNQYGDSINEKEALFLLLLETDSRNFIGL